MRSDLQMSFAPSSATVRTIPPGTSPRLDTPGVGDAYELPSRRRRQGGHGGAGTTARRERRQPDRRNTAVSAPSVEVRQKAAATVIRESQALRKRLAEDRAKAGQ